MAETIVCADCGKRAEKTGRKQKYCPACAEWLRGKELDAKLKKSAKLGTARVCLHCGKPLENTHGNRAYCPDCAEVERKERQKESHARSTPPKPLPKKDYAFLTPSAAPEGWSLAGKSADQVTAEARALGLSYGQYSSYVNSGMIEHYCRTLGVDGIAVTKKAWAEFKRHQKKLRTGKAA